MALEAARRMWRLDPRFALQRAGESFTQATLSAWLETAPNEYLGELLAILERRKAEVKPWIKDWLVERLPIAGIHARTVFDLLRVPIANSDRSRIADSGKSVGGLLSMKAGLVTRRRVRSKPS